MPLHTAAGRAARPATDSLRRLLPAAALAVLLLGGTVDTVASGASSTAARFEGTTILMTAEAELELANDEALAQFYIELQDGELARAQSQVNQKMAEAVAQLKRADPKAVVETTGYSSYPVYQPGTQRKLVGWRVRQSVSLQTTDLAALPRAVAVAQERLALGGIDFRLSRAAREKVEGALIERAIAQLNARIAAAARALGVTADRIRLEEVNFGVAPPAVPMARMRAEMMAASPAVEQPQFDAGRSLQRLTVTGKARLLPP
jgi:predicted secreted protein